jgi:hypothetical protein
MKLFLFFLILFVAVTATVSGALLAIYSDGSLFHMSTVILKTTPFSNFLVPGLILCLVVGGSNILAFILHLKAHPLRSSWTITGGIMVVGWVVVQMLLIGAVHWLQFVYLGIGIMILLLNWQLKGKWAV